MFTKERAINIFWGRHRALPNNIELCGVTTYGIVGVNRALERYYLLIGGVIKSFNGSFNAFVPNKG